MKNKDIKTIIKGTQQKIIKMKISKMIIIKKNKLIIKDRTRKELKSKILKQLKIIKSNKPNFLTKIRSSSIFNKLYNRKNLFKTTNKHNKNLYSKELLQKQLKK
jgi:hypothetical protein